MKDVVSMTTMAYEYGALLYIPYMTIMAMVSMKA